MLRIWLHLARAAKRGRRALAHHDANAIEPGVSAQERSDGWAGVMRTLEPISGWTKEGTQSDSDPEPERATPARVGAATGVLETAAAPAGESRSRPAH